MKRYTVILLYPPGVQRRYDSPQSQVEHVEADNAGAAMRLAQVNAAIQYNTSRVKGEHRRNWTHYQVGGCFYGHLDCLTYGGD